MVTFNETNKDYTYISKVQSIRKFHRSRSVSPERINLGRDPLEFLVQVLRTEEGDVSFSPSGGCSGNKNHGTSHHVASPGKNAYFLIVNGTRTDVHDLTTEKTKDAGLRTKRQPTDRPCIGFCLTHVHPCLSFVHSNNNAYVRNVCTSAGHSANFSFSSCLAFVTVFCL